MNKLNLMFLNEYNNAESACNAKFGVEGGGIKMYLGAMCAASEMKEKIGKWEEDYHTLSKCMHIYTVISMNGNKIRKPQCTKQDIVWLKKFTQRCEGGKDSLTKLEKRESAKARFEEKMEKVKPMARNIAIACGVALAVNALLEARKDKEDK